LRGFGETVLVGSVVPVVHGSHQGPNRDCIASISSALKTGSFSWAIMRLNAPCRFGGGHDFPFASRASFHPLGVRPLFSELHRVHACARFGRRDEPPWRTGTMWSTAEGHGQLQKWHVGLALTAAQSSGAMGSRRGNGIALMLVMLAQLQAAFALESAGPR
jgi:hypothetical protein